MAYQNPEKPVNAGKVLKTPAPVTRETSFGRETYGANAYDGPSSIMPGKSISMGSISDDIRQASGGALEHVIAKGAAMPSDDFQTRAISTDQKVPTARGMRKRGGPNDGSPS